MTKGLFRMWRLKPETAEEIEQTQTITGMRKRIREGSLFDPIVNQSLRSAEMQGLNGEETFVLLAYHALIAKEEIQLAYTEHFNICPVKLSPQL